MYNLRYHSGIIYHLRTSTWQNWMKKYLVPLLKSKGKWCAPLEFTYPSWLWYHPATFPMNTPLQKPLQRQAYCVHVVFVRKIVHFYGTVQSPYQWRTPMRMNFFSDKKYMYSLHVLGYYMHVLGPLGTGKLVYPPKKNIAPSCFILSLNGPILILSH